MLLIRRCQVVKCRGTHHTSKIVLTATIGLSGCAFGDRLHDSQVDIYVSRTASSSDIALIVQENFVDVRPPHALITLDAVGSAEWAMTTREFIDNRMASVDYGRVRVDTRALHYERIDRWEQIGGFSGLTRNEVESVLKLLTNRGIEYMEELSMEITLHVPANKATLATTRLASDMSDIFVKMKRDS